MLGDASLVRELSPDQSGHKGILVKVTFPAHLVARQVVEVHNTNSIEKEPTENAKNGMCLYDLIYSRYYYACKITKL